MNEKLERGSVITPIFPRDILMVVGSIKYGYSLISLKTGEYVIKSTLTLSELEQTIGDYELIESPFTISSVYFKGLR